MKEKQVILDGKFILASEIDKSKHTFIGIFRSPEPPCSDPTKTYAEYFLCDCGAMLSIREDIRRHWYEGHLDIPQYETI
jgi:hypothetical protein